MFWVAVSQRQAYAGHGLDMQLSIRHDSPVLARPLRRHIPGEQLDRVYRPMHGLPSEAARNQILGEAYFLRAFFYYELASQYGKVPLITTSESEDVPRAAASEIWGRSCIESEDRLRHHARPTCRYINA